MALTMKAAIDEVRRSTDLWPWYWLSYGEKEYAFAVVEAYPLKDGDPFPMPGSELRANYDGDETVWTGENGVKMSVESGNIAIIEEQNGDTLCRFIAMAHAELVKPLEE